MSKFSEQVQISISSFDKNIIYYDLKLSQQMADHHYFSFVWQYTGKPIIDPEDQEKAISKHNGSEVIFTFKVNGIRLMAKGIIDGLESIDENGSPVGLHVYGVSHTILLDDYPKSRIFQNKTLQQIALEIFGETNSDEFYQRAAIVPTYKKVFSSKPQYNETSFDFLKRLAARYGQWYYFDGMRMQFGQTKSSGVKLINGSSLHKFSTRTHLIAQKTSFGGYDYTSAVNIRNSANTVSSGSRDRFAVSNTYNQNSVARRDLSVGAYTNNALIKEEIEEMVSLETAAKEASGVFYGGISYYPLGVGQVFTIENKTIRHELLAIEVTHYSEVNGNYRCEFKAIPVDVKVPHYTNPKAFAQAESQPAKVIDNNDPQKMGRVRVEYFWNGWDNQSDWMRVVHAYAGNGKGVYFRTEIGEEVHVAFEGGNAECPYVSGAYHNGKEMPEFFDADNSIKGWKLRFGMLFKFIEKIGIWLSDPSGNEIHLDEESKNINVTSPETITIRAKNIVFEASESITYTAGQNISERAGFDKSTNVGMIHSTIVGGNQILNVTGNLHETIQGNIESHTDKDRITSSQKGIETSTEEGIEKHSQKETKLNSGEQSNLF